jgi:hypothetical protein
MDFFVAVIGAIVTLICIVFGLWTVAFVVGVPTLCTICKLIGLP